MSTVAYNVGRDCFKRDASAFRRWKAGVEEHRVGKITGRCAFGSSVCWAGLSSAFSVYVFPPS